MPAWLFGVLVVLFDIYGAMGGGWVERRLCRPRGRRGVRLALLSGRMESYALERAACFRWSKSLFRRKPRLRVHTSRRRAAASRSQRPRSIGFWRRSTARAKPASRPRSGRRWKRPAGSISGRAPGTADTAIRQSTGVESNPRCRPTPRPLKTTPPRQRRRFALPAILFVATCLSTFLAGRGRLESDRPHEMFYGNAAQLAAAFAAGRAERGLGGRHRRR